MFLQAVVLPLAYLIFSWKKIDPRLVVFADAHNNSAPESMRAFIEATRLCGDFKVSEIFHDYQAVSAFKSLMYSLSFMRIYAGAGHIVICDNFLPASACRKKSGTKVIQLWHACGAFKKFGLDTPDDIPSYYWGNVYKNYDTVCVSGESCVGPFSSAMGAGDKVVKALGVPRTDALLKSGRKEKIREAFYCRYPEASGKKILLWAPTFRGTALKPTVVGAEEIMDLQDNLKDTWYVISKLHPHLKTQINVGNSAPEFSSEELMLISDLLISDYSSIIFEYSLFLRPMVFWAPDLELYESARGFYLDFASLPGAVVTDGTKLKDTVISEYEGYDKKAAENFNKKYMSACDGAVTDRLISLMKSEKI